MDYNYMRGQGIVKRSGLAGSMDLCLPALTA